MHCVKSAWDDTALTPSPGPPRLEKAPAAVLPLPQGGEGRLSAVSSPGHPSPSVAARKVICQVCLLSTGLQDKGLIGESAGHG